MADYIEAAVVQGVFRDELLFRTEIFHIAAFTRFYHVEACAPEVMEACTFPKRFKKKDKRRVLEQYRNGFCIVIDDASQTISVLNTSFENLVTALRSEESFERCAPSRHL